MEVANNFEYLMSNHPKPVISKREGIPLGLRFIRLGFKTLGNVFPAKSAEYAFKLFTTPRTNAIHKKSDSILESARIFEFLYGKYLLKGYEWGSGKETILLVHGWRSRGTALRYFVPGLLAKGYRVVAFDAPAHGNSPGKSTTLPQFSGAIQAILNHLGGVDGVITHSFGGASTAYALHAPNNDFFVKKLVLIAAPSSMEYMIDGFAHMIQAPMPVVSNLYKILEKRLGIPLSEAHISKLYPDIRVGETLLVHDKKDEIVPFSEAESILDKWESARLLASDGYGHFHLMKNPDVVQRVVDFL